MWVCPSPGMPRAEQGWQWLCSAARPSQQLLCITGKGRSNFSFRWGSALSEETFRLEHEGQGCVTALWTAAHLVACLTWVKHKLGFVSEEIQHPAVKQQVFPKPVLCNAAGMKHQYFFQRVSCTKTLQTQPPPLARQVQPGCPGLTSNQPSL